MFTESLMKNYFHSVKIQKIKIFNTFVQIPPINCEEHVPCSAWAVYPLVYCLYTGHFEWVFQTCYRIQNGNPGSWDEQNLPCTNTPASCFVEDTLSALYVSWNKWKITSRKALKKCHNIDKSMNYNLSLKYLSLKDH